MRTAIDLLSPPILGCLLNAGKPIAGNGRPVRVIPDRPKKAARMQKRIKLSQQLLVAGCAGMLLASTGCRSAMPNWNMLSWRSTPSAETLAGDGPSTTYPAPPGENATPDAIASIAGGTAGSPVSAKIASSNTDPSAPVTGFDATGANPAAAQANGFSLASNRSTESKIPASSIGTSAGSMQLGAGSLGTTQTASNKNGSVPALPTGYQFGTRGSAPTSTANGLASPGGTAAGKSRYSMPTSYPAPGMPSTGSPSPGSPGASGYSLPGDVSPTSNETTTGGSSGFAMPDSLPKTTQNLSPGATSAKPFTPKTTPSVPGSDSIAESTTNAGFELPSSAGASTAASPASTGASAPSFSTASAALSPRSTGGLESNASGINAASGYAPGSTSGAGSYPTTSGYPSTGTDGSFYR